MNKAILIATLAIVFVAGCTQANITSLIQQNTNTMIAGAGMVMSDFSVDQPSVYSGQTDRIMMTVDNMGGYPVPDGASLAYLTGSAVSLTGDQSMYWTQPSGGSTTLIQKFNRDMNPADTVRDTPADEKTLTWSLKAPNVSRGQQTTYLFIGRVYYDYETKVNGNVWVYSQTESDAARAAGTTLNKATWSATSGPVAINAKVSQDPVILYNNENTFTLIIKVSSVGGGVLYRKGAIVYTTTDPQHLNLTEDDINRVLISGNVAGSPLPNDCTNSNQPIELVGGKTVTLSCDVTITAPTTFQGYPVSIVADYGYFNERSASVTVSGR